MEDFFISYNKADKLWAMGLGDWLDQSGYTTIFQEQDFVPSSNFVGEMHKALQRAKRMIMVLSPDYLSASFPFAEWTAAFAADPRSENGTLVPVRVRECKPDGLLRPIVYIDLVGLDVAKAKTAFLKGVESVLARKRKRGGRQRMSPSSGLPDSKPEAPQISQTAIGDHNTLIAGDQHVYQQPPKVHVTLERRDGAVSPAQARQIQEWIRTLAENTVGMGRTQAFGMWQNRFKYRFGLNRYDELLTEQFADAEAWYRQQMAIQTRGLKTKSPDAWRNARYAAIKQAMREMGVEKETYYPQLAARLKMKRAFSSLKNLTKRDLERAYTMALRDARGS